MTKAGEPLRQTLSRVICERMYGPPRPGDEAAHSCGNPECLNRRHVRWATHVENEADKRQHGTLNVGERNGHATLTTVEVDEIRRLRSGGLKLDEIAGRFGVQKSTVSRIANGIRRAAG